MIRKNTRSCTHRNCTRPSIFLRIIINLTRSSQCAVNLVQYVIANLNLKGLRFFLYTLYYYITLSNFVNLTLIPIYSTMFVPQILIVMTSNVTGNIFCFQ